MAPRSIDVWIKLEAGMMLSINCSSWAWVTVDIGREVTGPLIIENVIISKALQGEQFMLTIRDFAKVAYAMLLEALDMELPVTLVNK